jgi:hypothetical protein
VNEREREACVFSRSSRTPPLSRVNPLDTHRFKATPLLSNHVAGPADAAIAEALSFAARRAISWIYMNTTICGESETSVEKITQGKFFSQNVELWQFPLVKVTPSFFDEWLSLEKFFVCIQSTDRPPADWFRSRHDDLHRRLGRRPLCVDRRQ